MNGAIQFPMWQEGKCPGGAPEKGVWFKMSVAVRESSAIIEIDGKHLVTVKPHFHVFSRGGWYFIFLCAVSFIAFLLF